jgi:predicted RND superfamily exporter protein
MWIHTKSFFIAAVAMLFIILSFPLSYFIYRLIYRVTYFSPLQIMAIFLLLGIGADDVFVYVDAWKQSSVVLGANCDLERRTSWVYRRAAKAMFVTSFTTAVSFFINATNPIMPVATLGLWAGTLVMVLYLFAITAFPCAVVMWHRSLRLRSFANKCMLPVSRQEEEERHITQEDDERDVANDVANDSPIDDGGSNSGAPGDAKDVSESNTDELAQPRRVPFFKRLVSGRAKRDENEYRPIERFFRFKWIIWIHKTRFIAVALFVLLLGASAFFATRLNPLSKQEEFLRSDNPISVAFDLAEHAFPRINADNFVTVRAVYVWKSTLRFIG